MKKGDAVLVKSGDTTYEDLNVTVREVSGDWVKLSNNRWYDKTLLKRK
jgi:hypothetical protein